jgi:hypothetical protein
MERGRWVGNVKGEIPHSSLLNLLSSLLGGELESLALALVGLPAPLLDEAKGLMVSRWEAKGSVVVSLAGVVVMAGALVEMPVWMRGKLEISSMKGEDGGDVPCGWDSVVAML